MMSVVQKIKVFLSRRWFETLLALWFLGMAVVIGGSIAKGRIRNSLTCYNSAFEISYMSPPNTIIGSRPSQYGVWTLKDGAYVQNSGETCIVEKAQVEVQE
jgi:hypothetical protein